MSLLPRNAEWLNLNAQRHYPLVQNASGWDTTETFRLPSDFMVALYLTVPTALSISPGNFYIKTIGAFTTGYSVVIGYGDTIVASALIANAAQTSPNTPYKLNGIGDWLDCTGHLVIGTLDSIELQPAGQWEFTLATAGLEVDCIRPGIRTLGPLRCRNGGDTSAAIYGEVILAAGTNMSLVLDESVTPPVVTFNAIEGAGLNAECACVTDSIERKPIYTVNGISPTVEGNFTLLAGECVAITNIANGVQITNTCSQPCCGCTELTTLTQTAEALRQNIGTVEQFLATLEGRLSALDAALFASVLGDGGCTTC